MAVEFVGFPSFTGLLANLAGADTPLEIRAEFDLKTTTCGAFNASNIGALPGDTRYHAVAADADSNGNAAVDSSPDEYAELRAESLELEAMHNEVGAFASRRIVDKMYQILRNTASVTIRVSSRPVGTMEVMSVAEVIGVPNPSPLGNDTFVTLPSGLGTGTYSTLTTNSLPLVGAQARNHASVANSGVATSIWTWLRGVEEQTGDLR